MSDELKKKNSKSKMLLSEKESIDNKGNTIKASSELDFYAKNRASTHEFDRRRPFLNPRFSNPILPSNIKFGGLSYPNRNLIPDLMRMQPTQETKNFNIGPFNDLYHGKANNKMNRHLQMIKSPKSEMNNYLMRGPKSHGKGQQNRDFSAMVSVKDYKDNISNQDALSRRVKGDIPTNNVFYQNSSNNLPSNNISDHNFKSSILSFKDNQNDGANLSANVKPDDSMVVLQSLRFNTNPSGFYKSNPINFNTHFQYGNEPSFMPIHEPKHLPKINKLVNLKQVSFENQNKRNLSSPQLTRGQAVFHPIFPKKAIRQSMTSNNDDMLIQNNDLEGEKSPPFILSVDRETQILPTYNYSAKFANFNSALNGIYTKNQKFKISSQWEIQKVSKLTPRWTWAFSVTLAHQAFSFLQKLKSSNINTVLKRILQETNFQTRLSAL